MLETLEQMSHQTASSSGWSPRIVMELDQSELGQVRKGPRISDVHHPVTQLVVFSSEQHHLFAWRQVEQRVRGTFERQGLRLPYLAGSNWSS